MWRKHALERALARGISRGKIIACLENGEIIETYEQDRPYASALILSRTPEKLHVVAAVNTAENLCFVITAYVPDDEHFESDLKTRKKR